jgi:hypothetical protein
VSTVAKIRALLRDLIGQPCLSVLGSLGEPLVIDLGERRRRSLRLKNPRLSFEKRTYEGSAGLLIDCAWALDGPQGRVMTSLETTIHEGPPLVEVLQGDRIKKISLPAPGMDLVIDWKSGHRLTVLALRVDPRARRDNWAVWSPRGSFTIGPGGRIRAPKAPSGKASKDEDLVKLWLARWERADKPVPKAPKAEEE